MSLIDVLLAKHEALDVELQDSNNDFIISDWNCKHPFIEQYLSNIDVSLNTESKINKYAFFDDNDIVMSSIISFHQRFDNILLTKNNILASDGSTPLILLFCLWLLKNEVKEIFYIPPIYFTFHYLLKLFNIKARPISTYHSFEELFSPNFPDNKSILIVTDPTWYAGRSLSKNIVAQMRKWQQSTGSIIFIDGSFQYSKWDCTHIEETKHLEASQTFRLVCPSKSLGLHGFRFSYIILPEIFYSDFFKLNVNAHGPSAVFNNRFAERAMDILLADNSNFDLLRYIEKRFNLLIGRKIIGNYIDPKCGFFIFTQLNITDNHLFKLAMNGDYFEMPRFKDYFRLNIIGPNVDLLFL